MIRFARTTKQLHEFGGAVQGRFVISCCTDKHSEYMIVDPPYKFSRSPKCGQTCPDLSQNPIRRRSTVRTFQKVKTINFKVNQR